MYNTVAEQFDKLGFVDASDKIVGTLTLNIPIDFCCKDDGDPSQFDIMATYLPEYSPETWIFPHFLGHQGALARWLCIFCLARQNELHKA